MTEKHVSFEITCNDSDSAEFLLLSKQNKKLLLDLIDISPSYHQQGFVRTMLPKCQIRFFFCQHHMQSFHKSTSNITYKTVSYRYPLPYYIVIKTYAHVLSVKKLVKLLMKNYGNNSWSILNPVNLATFKKL